MSVWGFTVAYTLQTEYDVVTWMVWQVNDMLTTKPLHTVDQMFFTFSNHRSDLEAERKKHDSFKQRYSIQNYTTIWNISLIHGYSEGIVATAHEFSITFLKLRI